MVEKVMRFGEKEETAKANFAPHSCAKDNVSALTQ